MDPGVPEVIGVVADLLGLTGRQSYAMCETVTVQCLSAWTTVVSALATLILVAITGYYAWQTRKLVNIEAERSAFEANRAELESRPYLEVRFLDWDAVNLGPQFDVFNVGAGPAVRVRLDNPNDLSWMDSHANIQGFTTIATGLPPGRFAFRRHLSGGEPRTGDWSAEFGIRYNDASGLHEYADKWRLGVDHGVSYLVRVNATTLKTQPLESEDYVVRQGPQ